VNFAEVLDIGDAREPTNEAISVDDLPALSAALVDARLAGTVATCWRFDHGSVAR
jgi:hypothetical protein